MKILVYAGLYHANNFLPLLNNYDLCIGFEANPHLIPTIQDKVKNHSNVKIYNYAVGDKEEYVKFKISSNDGQSSSLTDFNEDYKNLWNGNLNMKSEVVVKKINLFLFLKSIGVEHITDYVSDIQGHDYTALSSMKTWIDDKKINTIQCEVHKLNKNVYSNVNNDISNFTQLLSTNYKLISTGWGNLVDGVYNQVPEEWWEYDAKWKLLD